MTKKTNFQILAQMARENKDIKMSTVFVKGNNVPQGAEITMGTDQAALLNLMRDTHQCILFVVDWNQYQEIAAQKNTGEPPVCGRCGKSMTDTIEYQEKVIGFFCGKCQDDWDNEPLKNEGENL